MAQHLPIKIGLSQRFPCSYLDEQEEQLLVILDPLCYTPQGFEALLQHGFRRSGEQIYRPHCPSCTACESVRILASEFTPSRSQKRKLNKVKEFAVHVSHFERPEYYPLYERYINERHSDGSMYPAERSQFESFLLCKWMNIAFIELWHQERLIGVAVTDVMPNSLSAIYTFFDPDYEALSLGSVMILKQIEHAQKLAKDFVYLGYQIDDCRKMRYKLQYRPAQRLHADAWIAVE
ncbi:arginyl-tRNA-protein transferase [Pseudoalteromonas sp. THAF3]|uniref:arginyltransferase n=1 Tax=Pseudoalteromonas sp. THAF3 TaxID=2587843 RepID=UPI001269719F|nr:arginyltransferase [Pseudoalteromonas sp. THAF3]QFU04820.1 arginyl-tRNA-protein transferase [Pseudoalteromonas sp. THAF3]